MDILLIAGLWLDGSAWKDVVPALKELGHRPVPITLPGQGDGAASATLEDQVGAVLAAVDAAPGPQVLVVGHSAACSLAWAAAEGRPERVAGVVLIGGFPSEDGDLYADFFEPKDGAVAFPGWEPFAGPDSDDLDEAARQAFESVAVSVPEAVTRGVMRLSNERRFDVPVSVLCPEFSPAQAREWIEGGKVPELAKAKHVDYLDIESGHWPMFTRPTELAQLLADAASAPHAER